MGMDYLFFIQEAWYLFMAMRNKHIDLIERHLRHIYVCFSKINVALGHDHLNLKIGGQKIINIGHL